MAYTSKQLSKLMVDKLRRTFGRDVSEATATDMFQACALVLRDIMSDNRVETREKTDKANARQVHYLSLEFLVGRSLERLQSGGSSPAAAGAGLSGLQCLRPL